MTDCNKDSTATKKINNFVERFSWWIVGIVVMILGSIYTGTTDRITSIEEKVSFLVQDKVSREELRSVTQDLRVQMDTVKTDIMSQQHSMKSDILSRLDYLLRLYPPASPIVSSVNK